MIDDRERLAATPAHDLALACVEAGIEAADPARAVADAIDVTGDRLTVDDATYDLADYERVVVLGGGKAADVVARELARRLDDRLDGGLVVTTDPVETGEVTVVEGSHPVPDEQGREGARRVLLRALEAGEATLLLVAVTGGGSALLPLPAGEVSLSALQTVTVDLVESGAAIGEINAVRKHVSAVTGGGLARAADPATVVGLLVSDVVGDDPGVIASGPTAPDPTTYEDALAVLERHDIDPPEVVGDHLRAGLAGEHAETPADLVDSDVDNHLLANAWTALSAAVDTADDRGYEPLVLSSRVRGEATEAGLSHLAVAEECRESGVPVEPPAVVLSGGETTVSGVTGGTGGPNVEFALRIAVEQSPGIVCASVDTDGSDGGTDAAGALVDGTTLDRTMDARVALAEHDAYPLLDDLGALVRTGPTGTNVNDLRVLVVPERAGDDEGADRAATDGGVEVAR